MIKYVVFCLFVVFYVFAYQDDELIHLWSQISDINHPTLEDYQRIDRYLTTGARPYLDRLRYAVPFDRTRMGRIMALQLIGDSQVMPTIKQYDINVTEGTNGRYILLYASNNGLYPEKARKVLQELKDVGYSGHVLLRLGGFPNVSFGGLKICHVPYAFKVAFLKEAQHLGCREVLWLDVALHPITDLNAIFEKIRERGYFFTYVGSLQDNNTTHLPLAAEAVGISCDLYPQIPHISSAILGFNMQNINAVQLLDAWYGVTEEVYPNMTWWPEELSLSVAAWYIGCRPLDWLGAVLCEEDELAHLEHRPTVQLYLDKLR